MCAGRWGAHKHHEGIGSGRGGCGHDRRGTVEGWEGEREGGNMAQGLGWLAPRAANDATGSLAQLCLRLGVTSASVLDRECVGSGCSSVFTGVFLCLWVYLVVSLCVVT